MSGKPDRDAGSPGEDTARRQEGRLELEVADFGPIGRARVQLRPLTVFVGPSDTGKSVLAILGYARHRFFDDHGSVHYGSWADGAMEGDPLPGTDGRGADLAEARPWLERVLSEWLAEKRHVDSVPLPRAAARLVGAAFGGPSDRGRRLDDEIARCFGVERSGKLVRRGTRRAAVTLRCGQAPGRRTLPSNITLRSTKTERVRCAPLSGRKSPSALT